MKVGENIQFCEACPLKGDCKGPIAEERPHMTDASFFSTSDRAVGVKINMGTYFYDQAGNKSDYFPPHTSLEDIANCAGLEVDYRTGFLRLRAWRDCGASVLRIHEFRQRMHGSVEPLKKSARRRRG